MSKTTARRKLFKHIDNHVLPLFDGNNMYGFAEEWAGQLQWGEFEGAELYEDMYSDAQRYIIDKIVERRS
jgi:hypothetical protein